MKSDLSDRETQILRLAAEGFTDQAIAIRLGISLATVGTYWGRIRTKQGQFNRTELVANYIKSLASARAHVLREENAQLIKQLEAEEKKQGELEDALTLFRSLFDGAPDGMLVIDDAGLIRLANEQAANLFGYTQGELEGESIAKLIPERFHGLHRKHREDYLGAPSKRPMGDHGGALGLHKDGREFPIAATLNAIPTNEGMLATCILRPLIS